MNFHFDCVYSREYFSNDEEIFFWARIIIKMNSGLGQLFAFRNKIGFRSLD